MSVIVVLYCLEAGAMCLSLAFYFLKKSVQGQFLFSMHYTQISPTLLNGSIIWLCQVVVFFTGIKNRSEKTKSRLKLNSP